MLFVVVAMGFIIGKGKERSRKKEEKQILCCLAPLIGEGKYKIYDLKPYLRIQSDNFRVRKEKQ